MSDFERSRIRKEAADAVTSRPPRDSDQAVDTALRRYLGIAMFDALRRRKDARRTAQPSPAGSAAKDASATKGPAPTKGAATTKGAPTTRKQGPRP